MTTAAETTTATEVFLTPTHIVKGCIPQWSARLSDFLTKFTRPVITIENAELRPPGSGPTLRLDKILLPRTEILIAHEYENTKGEPELAVEVRWVLALIQLRSLDCGAISGFVQERTAESPAPFFSVTNYRFADPAFPAPFEILGTLPYLIINRDAVSWIGEHPDR